jgi:hypothetical protein
MTGKTFQKGLICSMALCCHGEWLWHGLRMAQPHHALQVLDPVWPVRPPDVSATLPVGHQ